MEPIIKRCFNTTGVCQPQKHYMVDIQERLAKVKALVDAGSYFTINRARQFGKTTTLQALREYLGNDYFVISMDFQMQMSQAKFKDERSFSLAFAKAFTASFRSNSASKKNDNALVLADFIEAYKADGDALELVELFQYLSQLCAAMPKPVVLMIDEVDSATNNQVFLDFLAQLRGYFLNRNSFPTFHSVILASVCDIKNLKRKLRPDEEHRDNSPWNIAANFDIDMSFSAAQIKTMLDEYENDYATGMDKNFMAQEIHAFTSGYPYLVSRLCQLMAGSYDLGDKEAWTNAGLLHSVRTLLIESNSLFDDMCKKLKDFPALKDLLYQILFCGKGIPYHIAMEMVSIGSVFGFLKEEDGQVAVANRIFEIWFYNFFIAEESTGSKTYAAGQIGKSQFIKNNALDMELILRKFTEHFSEVYGSSSAAFVEEQGRKLFLLYIRPLINGVANYYIEARTRSMGRTDLIIDYLGQQYIIEMKIWHGDEYNKRGEEQLLAYLKDYGLKRGYMLSFNFNKHKQVGVKELHFKDCTLVEAVV